MRLNIKGNPVFVQHTSSIPNLGVGDIVDGSCLNEFRLLSKIISVTNSTNEIKNYSFKKIIIVGDSLSDSEGRMHSKTLGLIPSALQYYDGRFTNGYTWVDLLSSPTYMNVDVENKAEGGAVAGNYCKINPIFMFISSMKKQIKRLTFNENELAIVCIGSNDYITFDKKDVNKVINNQVKNINKMIKKGARNIVVMGIPDLSKTPYTKSKGKDYQDELQTISKHHNEMLVDKINNIRDETGVSIKYFDFNGIFDSIIENANALGYDTDSAFHQGYIGGGSLNINPDYIFLDSVHPTQEVHAIFAMKINEFISKEFNIQKG